MSYTFNPFTGNLDVTPFSLDGAGKIPSDYLPIGSGGEVELNLGSAGSPSLFFNGDANTGLYSPGADQVAISTNGTGRLFVDANGNVKVGSPNTSAVFNVQGSGGLGIDIAGRSSDGGSSLRLMNNAGSASNAALFGGDTYAGVSSATYLAFQTGGTERARIDSSGNVGIGTTGSNVRLTLNHPTSNTLVGFQQSGTTHAYIGTSSVTNGVINGATIGDLNLRSENKNINLSTGGSSSIAMRIDSSGNVGIGTSSPDRLLTVSNTSGNGQLARFIGPTNNLFIDNDRSGVIDIFTTGSGDSLSFGTVSTERLRIDSSGRLLVGTSTARLHASGTTPTLQVEGSSGALSIRRNIAIATALPANFFIGRARGGAFEAVTSGDYLGKISFTGADGSAQIAAATIEAIVDGTPGANDMPGRLVFSTTADGASSPTERMRITQNGEVQFGDSTTRNRAITSETDYYTDGRNRGASPWFVQRYAHKASGAGNAARAVITFSASAGSPEAFHRVKVTQSGSVTRAYYEFLVSETSGTFSVVHDLADYNKAQFTVSMSSPTLTITSGTASADWMDMCVEVETFEMGASMPSITTSTV